MQEIPVSQIIRALTPGRILNAGKAIASFGLSALTGKTRVWGRPFILTVEPTNICNLKCPLCVTGNGTMTRKAGLMDLETFRTVLQETQHHLLYLLLYHQGEPYLNADSLNFIALAKKYRICVATSTNGHYLDRQAAEKTVASGLDSIIISVDGAHQASYEKYRMHGSLDKVKEGVLNLVEARKNAGSKTPYIYLQFLVMKQNEHELHEMRLLAARMGVERLLVKTLQVETEQEARDWLPEDPALTRYRLADDGLAPRRSASGPCARPWTSSLVNWDGTIVPCCFDKNGAHKMGVAQEQTFNLTWYSRGYSDFRNKMLRNRNAIDICSNCSQGLKLYR